MRPSQDSTPGPGAHADDVPRLPLHRRYCCASCSGTVEICSPCDRGNIYCPDCMPRMKRARLVRARRRYRETQNGRDVRNAGNRRRRQRKKFGLGEGDRGSPSQVEQGNDGRGQLGPPVGDSHDAPDDDFEPRVDTQGEPPPAPAGKLVCPFCLRPCSPFHRQSAGRRWRAEKRALEGASLFRSARGPPDRGGTP